MPSTVTLIQRGENLHTFDNYARCVIGRAADCDIQLNQGAGDGEVSRHHCVLELDPPHARVRDLGSLNGTFVNGVLIGHRPCHLSPEQSDPTSLPACPLHDGDEIRVGDTVFRVGIVMLSPAAG